MNYMLLINSVVHISPTHKRSQPHTIIISTHQHNLNHKPLPLDWYPATWCLCLKLHQCLNCPAMCWKHALQLERAEDFHQLIPCLMHVPLHHLLAGKQTEMKQTFFHEEVHDESIRTELISMMTAAKNVSCVY